jgi:transcriptional regulator with XRE-family HTH domain
MELGTKIKKIRELRNLTQEYLADQLGISQPAYSKLELHISKNTFSVGNFFPVSIRWRELGLSVPLY